MREVIVTGAAAIILSAGISYHVQRKETERWKDVEEEDGSVGHREVQLEWDFADFRTSNISSHILGLREGGKKNGHGQPQAPVRQKAGAVHAMATQIKF